MNSFTELFGEIAIAGLHLFSQHEERQYSYNNLNLGYYAITDKGYGAGVFDNSVDKTAVWVGRQFKYTDPDKRYDLALMVGGIIGYKADPLDPIPLLSPSAAKHFGDFAVRLNYTPKYNRLPRASAVWHFTLEYKLR